MYYNDAGWKTHRKIKRIMNKEETSQMHITTSQWLMEQSEIVLRKFKLERNPKKREQYQKQLLEIKGRMISEVGNLREITGE